MMRRYSLNYLLVLFATVGFLFLSVDTIIEHRNMFTQELFVYLPPLFGFCAVAVGVAALLRWNARRIRLFHLTLIISLAVAAAGMYFHLTEEEKEGMTAEEQAHEAREKEKPPLAPLSFAGVAIAGLLGTSRKWPAEIASPIRGAGSEMHPAH